MMIQEQLEEARKLRDDGRLVDAALLYSEIIKAVPDNAEIYYEWGCVAYDRGVLRNARKLLEKARQLDPDIAGVHSKLGAIYAQFGWCGWARQSFEKALELDAHFMPAYSNLALMHVDIVRDYGAAEDAARRGLEKDKEYGALYVTLGKALRMQGKAEEAIAAIKKALKLMPETEAENLCNLATLYADMGDKEKAESLFKKILVQHADFPEAHSRYSGVHKYSKDDEHITEMEALLKSAPEKSKLAQYLSFALAKAYDDIKDYDAAFTHYTRGNWIARSGFDYQAEAPQRNFANIKSVFPDNFTKKALDVRKDDFTPIFIVGMPRSGTTLIEQILFSHPDVGAAGEMPYFDQLQSQYEFGRFENYGADILNFPDESLKAIRDDYLYRLGRHAPDMKMITDKLPTNFRFLGLIRLVFPQAKIIHCRRDPMDTCFSIYKHDFTGYLPFAYDLHELGQYYKAYEDLMVFWHEKMPGFIHDIQYEDLIADQVGETRKLLEFCGLSWDALCLKFYEQKRTVTTASTFQVKEPLFSAGVGRWKKYEKHLGVLKEVLGRA